MNRKQNRKINRKPAEWQTNPFNVTTPKVQYWRNGIMMSAEVSLIAARNSISEGSAFVISEQAIGALIDGQMAG